MDRTVQKRIFEAFFTTKEETGTGLGLGRVEEIIRKHKGIDPPAQPTDRGDKSSGTVFQIFIPDVVQTLDAPRPKQTQEALLVTDIRIRQ